MWAKADAVGNSRPPRAVSCPRRRPVRRRRIVHMSTAFPGAQRPALSSASREIDFMTASRPRARFPSPHFLGRTKLEASPLQSADG